MLKHIPRFLHSIIHHPPSIIHHPSSIIHHPSSIIHHPLSIIHHPSSIIHHPSSIIHHPSSIIHHPSSIIHHPSSIISHLIDCLPPEQDWISQSSLISNYDHDIRIVLLQGNGHSCRGLPFGDGLIRLGYLLPCFSES